MRNGYFKNSFIKKSDIFKVLTTKLELKNNFKRNRRELKPSYHWDLVSRCFRASRNFFEFDATRWKFAHCLCASANCKRPQEFLFFQFEYNETEVIQNNDRRHDHQYFLFNYQMPSYMFISIKTYFIIRIG